MGFTKEKVIIDITDMYLDIDNPRLQSKLIIDKKNYGVKEQQNILVFLLLSYDNVDGLLIDMIQNTAVTKEMLENDIILVQKIEDNFIIKEGNRRICALKILFDDTLLDTTLSFVNKDKVFRDAPEYSKFIESMKEIRKAFEEFDYETNRSLLEGLFQIECKVYGNDIESATMLELLLRRLHIYQKREWKVADKQLFEYEIIMKELKKGANSINEAIDNALSVDVDGKVNNNVQKKHMKKLFDYSNFYHYLINRLEKKLEVDEVSEEIIIKFKRSPLPICETLVNRLSTDFQLKLYFGLDVYNEETNTFNYRFIQRKDGIRIKEPEKLVDALALEILGSRTKPIPNTEFKTTSGFKQVFSHIIDKYTITSNDGENYVYYEIWKNDSNHEIDEIIEKGIVKEIMFNGNVCSMYQCEIPGEWRIKTNTKTYIVTVKEYKNPTIVQKIYTVLTNRDYNLNDLFDFKNSFDEDRDLRPKHLPKIIPMNDVDYDNKKKVIRFRNSGNFDISFSLEDKKTKLSCSHTFSLEAQVYRPKLPIADISPKLNYITSYFGKEKLNLKSDISCFIVELNRAVTDDNIEMIYIASFRSLVELVVNDINEIIKLKVDSSDLGPKYKLVLDYALNSNNFLDIVKTNYSSEYYDILRSYTKQVSTSVNKDGFIAFLNLSTHSTGRFTNKKMVNERKIFVEYLINYLDFLNDLV